MLLAISSGLLMWHNYLTHGGILVTIRTWLLSSIVKQSFHLARRGLLKREIELKQCFGCSWQIIKIHSWWCTIEASKNDTPPLWIVICVLAGKQNHINSDFEALEGNWIIGILPVGIRNIKVRKQWILEGQQLSQILISPLPRNKNKYLESYPYSFPLSKQWRGREEEPWLPRLHVYHFLSLLHEYWNARRIHSDLWSHGCGMHMLSCSLELGSWVEKNFPVFSNDLVFRLK